MGLLVKPNQTAIQHILFCFVQLLEASWRLRGRNEITSYENQEPSSRRAMKHLQELSYVKQWQCSASSLRAHMEVTVNDHRPKAMQVRLVELPYRAAFPAENMESTTTIRRAIGNQGRRMAISDKLGH